MLDRGIPVARLVPPAAGDDDEARERLIGAGVLRPGTRNTATILEEPPLELPTGLSEALSKGRINRL